MEQLNEVFNAVKNEVRSNPDAQIFEEKLVIPRFFSFYLKITRIVGFFLIFFCHFGLFFGFIHSYVNFLFFLDDSD